MQLLESEMEHNPQVRSMLSVVSPLKRAAECEGVVDVVAFLCSLTASYINGTSLITDAAIATTINFY